MQRAVQAERQRSALGGGNHGPAADQHQRRRGDELRQHVSGLQLQQGLPTGIAAVGRGSPAATARCLWPAARSSVILLHPPLPLAGASVEMERARQQNGGVANGGLLPSSAARAVALGDGASHV